MRDDEEYQEIRCYYLVYDIKFSNVNILSESKQTAWHILLSTDKEGTYSSTFRTSTNTPVDDSHKFIYESSIYVQDNDRQWSFHFTTAH